MDISSINSDLIRGNVTTIILKALMDEDRYGYDILREIEVKSEGVYKLKQPTLYSCLKRLEKQGLISSYWGDQDDTEGGRRRYYSLTDAGRAFVQKMQSEYEYSRTILDKLLSEEEFDFESKPAPFDINGLRPYTKRQANENDDIEEEAKPSERAPISAPMSDVAPTPLEKPVELSTEEKPVVYNVEGSSYDDRPRTTASSLKDMLSKINSVVDKKKETETEPVVEKKLVIAESPEEQSAEKREYYRPEKLENREDFRLPPEPLSEEALKKREEALKALGLGKFNEENVINVEKLEETYKKTEDELTSVEAPAEPERKFDIFSKVPIDKQLHPEKYANDTALEESVIVGKTSAFSSNPIIDLSPRAEIKPAPLPDRPVKPSAEPEPKRFEAPQFEKSPVAPATSYSFRNAETNVNYHDAFSQLRHTENEDIPEDGFVQRPASSIDLKTKLYSAGYRLKTYTRENTEEYYSLNFIHSNRLSRDCYALMYALYLVEVFVMWLVMKDAFTPVQYVIAACIGLPFALVPFVIYTLRPDKRVRASFNLRTSILNRLMLYLNCVVIVCLVGFFAVGADVNDGDTMVKPILLPVLFLLNIPLSSLVYFLLYNTRRYHIS
jgi:Predicted transcriptional regulators